MGVLENVLNQELKHYENYGAEREVHCYIIDFARHF